jgi:hypothetical protein
VCSLFRAFHSFLASGAAFKRGGLKRFRRGQNTAKRDFRYDVNDSKNPFNQAIGGNSEVGRITQGDRLKWVLMDSFSLAKQDQVGVYGICLPPVLAQWT